MHLAQAHGTAPALKMDLTDYVCKNLTGFREVSMNNGFSPRAFYGRKWRG
jgi:hypothetical protein